MSMENDQESLHFWSTILQTLTDSDPKNDLNPEINSPILVMSTSMAVNVPPEPSNPHGVGDKEAGQEKVPSEDGDQKMNVDRGKSITIEIEEVTNSFFGHMHMYDEFELIKKKFVFCLIKCKEKEEERKNLKRPNEARNMAEKVKILVLFV